MLVPNGFNDWVPKDHFRMNWNNINQSIRKWSPAIREFCRNVRQSRYYTYCFNYENDLFGISYILSSRRVPRITYIFSKLPYLKPNFKCSLAFYGCTIVFQDEDVKVTKKEGHNSVVFVFDMTFLENLGASVKIKVSNLIFYIRCYDIINLFGNVLSFILSVFLNLC